MNNVWESPGDVEDDQPKTGENPEQAGETDRFVPTEQRSAVDSDRRSDEDRRQSEEPFEGEEKRRIGEEPEAEVPERLSGDIRRGISFDIKCKTAGSIGAIEDWLDDHCEGQWNVVLEDMDAALVNKNLRVMFEYEDERKKFFLLYIKGQGEEGEEEEE
jgi:hypothetical protein